MCNALGFVLGLVLGLFDTWKLIFGAKNVNREFSEQ
jgi:hypothetical protein